MKNSTIWFGLLLSLGLSGVTRADDVDETRLVESARAGRWAEAADHWRQLDERVDEPALRLVFLAAQVELELKRDEHAEDLLLRVLEREADHLEALYLLAQLRARQGRLADTRALLLDSARAGQAVLRDLETGHEPALAPLRRDPTFLLEVMQASRGVTLDAPLRDPFARPTSSPEATCPPRTGPETPAEVQALVRGIERLLERAREQAKAREVDALQATLAETRELLIRLDRAAPGKADEALERLRRDMGEVEELFAALQLQLWVARGNHLLRVMARAAEETRWDKALAAYAELEGLCATMSARERVVFQRNAQALRQRGLALKRHVEVRKEIEGLSLRVSGIVIPPPGDEAGRHAIVSDRILREGDEVRDGFGERTGVVVEEVRQGSVTFRYRGVRFVRALEPKR